MNLGDLNKVWEVKPLNKPGQEEARNILNKIAKQVQPIMKKHKWRVNLLSEMSESDDPSHVGLNIGGGHEVRLRLRRFNRDWDFIPYEQVLDTMLHELCHNDIGPHNADFYKLWDDIRKECDELVAKGVSGNEGFDGHGRRLGGFSRQPTIPGVRQAALAAAEKRSRIGGLLPSGPKRLGGDSDMMSVLSPLQAAAMAAERRMQDELWCGSQANGVYGEGSKSGGGAKTVSLDKTATQKNRIIDEIRTTNIPSNMRHIPGFMENDIGASNSGFVHDHKETHGTEDKSVWECEICTLLNPSVALICEACGVQRPKGAETKFKIWSCKFCTLDNSVKLDKCSACGQWRYSYGAPMFSQLKLGT